MNAPALPPTAPTTLVIVLGASAWPNSPGFQASRAFAHAAQGFRDYVLDPQSLGLPVANLLDQFDASASASDQLEMLGSFLEQRMQALKAANQAARDVLVYFVGHGGFVGPSADFYLLPRRANASSLRASGMAIDALAEVLREKARQTRRYLFLDCCFAAAAFRAFQGGPDQTAITKTLDAFAVQTRSRGFPRKGTVLLCSSDQKSPSLLLPDESCTMFSYALLDVLRHGDPHRPQQLSLRDIKELVEDRLVTLPEKNAPHPGLHSPDQSEGDVADVRFFPNPLTSPPFIPGNQPGQEPPPKVMVANSITRRKFVVGLGLAGLTVAGGGIAWLVSSQGQHSPPVSVQTPASTSHRTPTPTLTSLFVGTPLYTYHGHSDHVNAAAWSTDGKRVASGSDDKTVQVWNAADGSPVYTYHGHSNGVNAVAWSPDGKHIASASDDKTVQVWDATTGKTPFMYRHHSKEVRDVAWWSPDGKRIASASYDGTVQIWDATTGRLFLTYKRHTNWVFGVAWSPDGKLIASASSDTTAQVWDASTGNVRFTYTGHTDTVKHVAWSPDSRRIASASYDKTARVWDATTGDNEIPYTNHTDAVLNVAWSPNGQYIASASADKTARVWNVATGDTLRIYTGHNYQVNEASWSPDGKFLVTASDDTRVRIWPTP